MDFVLGKQLRVLSVVEFVLLFVAMLPCLNITYTDTRPESQRSVETVERINKIIGLFFSTLGLAIYIAILVLLKQDLSPCQSSLTNTVLILAVICLALKLVYMVMPWLLSKFPEAKMPVEVEEKLTDRVTKATLKAPFRLMNRIESVMESRFSRWIICALAVPFVLFVLGMIALGIFSFATNIKLAIPGEYEASCTANSRTAKVIAVGLPSLAVALYVLLLVFTGLIYFSERKVGLSIAASVICIVLTIVIAVLVAILSVRLTKIWRGEDIELYEYLALAVSLPLLST